MLQALQGEFWLEAWVKGRETMFANVALEAHHVSEDATPIQHALQEFSSKSKMDVRCAYGDGGFWADGEGLGVRGLFVLGRRKEAPKVRRTDVPDVRCIFERSGGEGRILEA